MVSLLVAKFADRGGSVSLNVSTLNDIVLRSAAAKEMFSKAKYTVAASPPISKPDPKPFVVIGFSRSVVTLQYPTDPQQTTFAERLRFDSIDSIHSPFYTLEFPPTLDTKYSHSLSNSVFGTLPLVGSLCETTLDPILLHILTHLKW